MRVSQIILSVSVSALVALPAFAAKYTLDAAHSSIGFKVKHLGIASVPGTFGKYEGTFDFDDKTGKIENMKVTIDADSINTNEADRDKHLRGDDFFKVTEPKNAKIEFTSTKVDVVNKKPTKLHGNLTMMGVTKPVTFTVDYKGMASDPWGNTAMVFEANTKLNRKDFGLTWNKTLDKGGVLVGDEVAVNVAAQAKAVKTSP